MSAKLFTQNKDKINQEESIKLLEGGQVLFFPEYFFQALDASLMTPAILDGKHKNVGYDYKKKKLGGYAKDKDIEKILEKGMRAYAEFAFQLIQATLPHYVPHLKWGRTSFRPAQISGRSSSKRKDDTRLHVDSFTSSPVNGRRILRVFCNINPNDEPRIWNLGEPFTEILEHFASQIPPYSLIKAKLLQWFKGTKTLRSPYDHYMLNLHDMMKLDDRYQQEVEKTQVNFPSKSTWIVFTDQVSHAALSGQFLLEQTFYLPVRHMKNPEFAPLNQLKKVIHSKELQNMRA